MHLPIELVLLLASAAGPAEELRIEAIGATSHQAVEETPAPEPTHAPIPCPACGMG